MQKGGLCRQTAGGRRGPSTAPGFDLEDELDMDLGDDEEAWGLEGETWGDLVRSGGFDKQRIDQVNRLVMLWLFPK